MGMLLTGRRITAHELHQLGLINEVTPTPQLDATVDRWISQILACAPTATKAIKELVRHADRQAIREAAALRLPKMTQALHSTNVDEGLRAHLEKRPPRWTSD